MQKPDMALVDHAFALTFAPVRRSFFDSGLGQEAIRDIILIASAGLPPIPHPHPKEVNSLGSHTST